MSVAYDPSECQRMAELIRSSTVWPDGVSAEDAATLADQLEASGRELLTAKAALRAILPVYRAAAGLAYPYAQLAYNASRRTITPEISAFLDGLEDK